MKNSNFTKLQSADQKAVKNFNSKYGRPSLFLTKKGDLNSNVENAIRGSQFDGNKIYPFQWTGSGRYINAKDYSAYIFSLLKAFGYKYTVGNDAPKGGKAGNFIKVSATAKKAILSLIQ